MLIYFYVGVRKDYTNEVVLCLGRTPEARVLSPPPPSPPRMSKSRHYRSKPSGFTCCFLVDLVTKKHKYFPGIFDAAGGRADTPPVSGLSFQKRYVFLYSLLKSAAIAALKLSSAVISIAHVLSVSIKSMFISFMLLEYLLGKLKFDSISPYVWFLRAFISFCL